MKAKILVSGIVLALLFSGCLGGEPEPLNENGENRNTCTYSNEDGSEVEAECNSLIIIVDSALIDEQRIQEIEAVIENYDAEVKSKLIEDTIWVVEMQSDEKIYELKNALEEFDNVQTEFNMLVGFDFSELETMN
jgi:PBP1b-binding outer membrane lipoprotein LpoB